MRLQPRERKVSPNYLIDNADALHLGKLYLGWDVKRRSSKAGAKKAPSASAKGKTRAKTTAHAVASAKAAATQNRTVKASGKKKEPAAAAAGGPVVKVAAKKAAIAAGKSKTTKKAAKKAVKHQATAAAAVTVSGKPADTLPSGLRKVELPPAAGSGLLPVTKNAAAPSVRDDSQCLVTPFVRLMDGRTVTITVNTRATVADLKQQIFTMLNPGRLMDRTPHLLLNGSAHNRDEMTLAQAGLTSSSVLYFF